MHNAHLESLPVAFDFPEIRARYAEVGPYTVGVEEYKAHHDPAFLFKGLPADRCQAPHWGYVTSGRITFKFADHEETFVAGDAYWVGPGHTPAFHPDSAVIEFTPTEEGQATMAVIEANLAAMQG